MQPRNLFYTEQKLFRQPKLSIHKFYRLSRRPHRILSIPKRTSTMVHFENSRTSTSFPHLVKNHFRIFFFFIIDFNNRRNKFRKYCMEIYKNNSSHLHYWHSRYATRRLCQERFARIFSQPTTWHPNFANRIARKKVINFASK